MALLVTLSADFMLRNGNVKEGVRKASSKARPRPRTTMHSLVPRHSNLVEDSHSQQAPSFSLQHGHHGRTHPVLRCDQEALGRCGHRDYFHGCVILDSRAR
jgi:hypothetical protein